MSATSKTGWSPEMLQTFMAVPKIKGEDPNVLKLFMRGFVRPAPAPPYWFYTQKGYALRERILSAAQAIAGRISPPLPPPLPGAMPRGAARMSYVSPDGRFVMKGDFVNIRRGSYMGHAYETVEPIQITVGGGGAGNAGTYSRMTEEIKKVTTEAYRRAVIGRGIVGTDKRIDQDWLDRYEQWKSLRGTMGISSKQFGRVFDMVMTATRKLTDRKRERTLYDRVLWRLLARPFKPSASRADRFDYIRKTIIREAARS